MRGYTEDLGLASVQAFRDGLGNYNTPQNAFLTGKAAMVVQGPWLANIINEFAPGLDYGVAPFPVVESLFDENAPVALIDTDVLVIPRGARHPEASMEFIAYTQRQAVTEYLATKHCKPSPLATCTEEFLANHPNKGIRVHNDLARSSRAFVCPQTRTWPQYKDAFDSAVQRIWKLEAPVAEILAGVQRSAQQAIDRAARLQRRREGGPPSGAPAGGRDSA
jgi:multiple sugar transport system substrate-binding protein